MNNYYRAVLFDLDYTLVDATVGIVKCTSHALEKLNYACDESKIKTSIGMSFSETFSHLTSVSCFEQANQFQNHFLEMAKEYLTDNTIFYADAFFVLKYLKACDIKLGLVTSKYKAEVIELLKKHKLLKTFDFVICGDEVESTKPHPESILKALSALKLCNSETLYVGDNTIDSMASQAANIDFIGITTGVFSYDELSNTHHKYIVNCLSELLTLNLFNSNVNNTALYPNLITDLQKIIDKHVDNVGGYWPAEFGLARLFEEVSELYSCIFFNNGNLIDELADVFIISVCIANQYCSNLSSTSPVRSDCSITSSLHQLVVITGELSRTVNFYEGFKTPKQSDEVKPIEGLISKLHHIILNICDLSHVNLFEAVTRKIIKANSRDHKRFSKCFDPSSALSVTQLKIIQDKIPCVYAKKAKIWGALPWDDNHSISHNSKLIFPTLKRFTKICKHESLDVFVIAAPDIYGSNITDLSLFLKELLMSLAEIDENNNCMNQKIDDPEWQFTFNDTRLFITIFASCYPSTNSRYNHGTNATLVLFQPEASFTGNKMPRGSNEIIRNKIRSNFKKNGQDYTNEIIKSNIEAARYIKPINLDGEVVTWWM